MKDFFKKLTKPQPEVEDLDTGYDSEYYAGSYDKADRRAEGRPEGRPEEDRRADRYEERDYRAERTDRAERVEREDDYYAPRTGLYVEEDAPAYRERVEEKVEPVFAPEPTPEYLYYTPASYRDCREGIVKGLAAGHVVVVRLGDLEASDVLRLFDYMMGAVLALNAELVRPEATTVVLVPDGVELDEDELELDDEDEEEYEDDEEYDEDGEYEEYDEEEYEEYDEEEYGEDADEDVE
ncbi:MAG: cell division protein SepF [Clostridia bacterium]|nr:cell division protein SepF [Clostridia bacterium]